MIHVSGNDQAVAFGHSGGPALQSGPDLCTILYQQVLRICRLSLTLGRIPCVLVNIEEIDWGLSAQSCMLHSTRYDIIVLQLRVMGSVMLDSYEQSTRAGAIRAGNALPPIASEFAGNGPMGLL